MAKLADLIAPLIEAVATGRTEVYNEFSLQHELGVLLRVRHPNYKVQFERNVSFFFGAKPPFTKREIDISVFSPDMKDLKYAVELKYPRNGQYPEQMFSFCKDLVFAEELKSAGFSQAGLVIFAEDSLFYEGAGEGIYSFFRGGRPIHGRIGKPTGSKDDAVEIRGNYSVQWKPVCTSLMYATIEAI